MSAGRLRDRVEIQRLVRVSDGEGGELETWPVLWANVPAAVLPVGGAGERVYGETRLEAPAVFDVLLRYRADYLPRASDRIVYGSRLLMIRGLEDIDNAHQFWRLSCVEDV